MAVSLQGLDERTAGLGLVTDGLQGLQILRALGPENQPEFLLLGGFSLFYLGGQGDFQLAVFRKGERTVRQ